VKNEEEKDIDLILTLYKRMICASVLQRSCLSARLSRLYVALNGELYGDKGNELRKKRDDRFILCLKVLPHHLSGGA